jgi:epoxyqueuosine reductase QueG
MMKNDIFSKLVDRFKECDFSFIPLPKLEPREKEYFKKFMPSVKTAIVVYYPIKSLKDYTWYCPDSTLQSERCNIDDWANEICVHIKEEFITNNFNTLIVPYPQNSGLQFRFVALASGCGQIGENAFYLHPRWGNKVHLRVLATEMTSELLCSIEPKTDRVCMECEKCIEICPAGAFETGFDGLKCRTFRKKRGEYIPIGEKGLLRYCTICLRNCNAGKHTLL